MPIALTLSAGLSSLALGLNYISKIQSLCRSQSLILQRDLATKLKDLKSLNPKARRLRIQLRAAQAALAAAVATLNPKAIAAAKAHLKWVTTEQKILKARQMQILLEANLLRTKKLSQLQNSMRQTQKNTSVVMHTHLPTALAVLPIPVASMSPSYKAMPGFSQMQSFGLKWRLPYKDLMPYWLTRFLPIYGNIEGSCGATLFKRGKAWQSQLTAVKF